MSCRGLRRIGGVCWVLAGFLVALAMAGRVWGQVVVDEVEARLPDPKVEAAIQRALEHLAASQKPDGSWEASFGKATSVTSLAVMSFLACGHLPGQEGPYRQTIEKGVEFVINSQKPNGLLVASTSHGPMYCHGISTLMLAEVVGMVPGATLEGRAREALGRAVTLILQAQAVRKNESNEGGWRYQPNSNDSDLSVTGWQVMALRAAKSAGMAVPAQAIDGAVAYVKRCASRGGGFSYQPGGGPNNPRTGVGILALELCGEHHTKEALAGAGYLAKNAPRWGDQYFFYEVYYCPQALFQIGDEVFRPYQERLTAILLEHQEADGSWLSPDGNDRSGGRDYCTAMGVLALAVEYRYLPIYQR